MKSELHKWERQTLPGPMKNVEWKCSDCSLIVKANQKVSESEIEEACIERGMKYACCQNFKESIVSEIMNS